MISFKKYKVLNKQLFSLNNLRLIPLRASDRFLIRKWRNEQLYHLRQQQELTESDQNRYFENVVAPLFEMDRPSQVLFSFLENDECIGYGGLVHINWKDKNAEVSFIMDTQLEATGFDKYWAAFLKLVSIVAFEELQLKKIFTWAFDVRPNLYPVLLQNGFRFEARLTNHTSFGSGYVDVLIHSKFSAQPILRSATYNDLEKTYLWATDPLVRKYSFSNTEIQKLDHSTWFFEKLNQRNCLYLIFEKENESIGSIRFDIEGRTAIISYLIDPKFHGMGYGYALLKQAEEYIKNVRKDVNLLRGKVMSENVASVKLFLKNEYQQLSEETNILLFEKIIN
ncbi:MAG: GNAT family N-acetyltransferase [Hydrotalea sp.]|nr:GNAT family N-acetyltransferase [Hydrotalea sp.]